MLEFCFRPVATCTSTSMTNARGTFLQRPPTFHSCHGFLVLLFPLYHHIRPLSRGFELGATERDGTSQGCMGKSAQTSCHPPFVWRHPCVCGLPRVPVLATTPPFSPALTFPVLHCISAWQFRHCGATCNAMSPYTPSQGSRGTTHLSRSLFAASSASWSCVMLREWPPRAFTVDASRHWPSRSL